MSKKLTAKSKSTSGSPDLAHLERVFTLMAKHRVNEVEWEDQKGRLFVRFGDASVGAPVAVSAESSVSVKEKKSEPVTLPKNRKQVVSPFVGVFYRSAKPGAEPYVKEGQVVKKGQPLCIVEAMKLMNEIETEWSGKIISILVENGQPVEYGEPLFIVET